MNTPKAKIEYNPANLTSIFKALLGFYSIIATLLGQPFVGMKFILISLVLDSFDGRIARFFKYDSSYGAILDSLSDLISFGISPAIIVASLLDTDLYLKVGICSFLLACFILQLARSTRQSTLIEFIGLPTHIVALGIVGIFTSGSYPPVVSMILLILISLLMISNIEYYSLKSGKEQTFLLVPAVLIIGIILFDQIADSLGLLLSLTVFLYIAFVPFYRKAIAR